jgi:hypothetical protein
MPTCIKCEKVMKSDYKKIPTLDNKLTKGSAWACSDRFCNVDLDLKNGYENLEGVWNIVNKPKQNEELDYRNSEEYKEYERVNRQNLVDKKEKISLFGITMINMYRREMGKMREEKDKLKEQLRVLKGEDHYACGWVCWENMSLNQGWLITRLDD